GDYVTARCFPLRRSCDWHRVGLHSRRRKMKTSFVGFTSRSLFIATLCAFVAPAYAAKSIKVTMNLITADGVGKSVGTITIKEGKDGVPLEPNLKDLPPGEHGFHVHENPSCDPADKEGKKTAGQAAGAHFDPAG